MQLAPNNTSEKLGFHDKNCPIYLHKNNDIFWLFLLKGFDSELRNAYK